MIFFKSDLDTYEKSQKNHTHQKYILRHISERKFKNIFILAWFSYFIVLPTLNWVQITIVNWHKFFPKNSSFLGGEREIFMMVGQKYRQTTQNSKTNRMVVLTTSESHFLRRNRRKTVKFGGGHFFVTPLYLLNTRIGWVSPTG